MKNKNKALLFFIVLLCAGFFGLVAISSAEDSVVISAVQIYGNSSNNDFIELYNPTCSSINISKWKLRSRNSSVSATESSIKVLSDNQEIPAKGYFLWANSSFGSLISADESSTATLANNYSLAILSPEDKIVDSITWGSNHKPFAGTHLYAENPGKLQTLKKDAEDNFTTESNYAPKNSLFINNDELSLCAEAEPKIYSNKIHINEILPNAEEEFIEIYNPTEKDEDLSGWILRDASKTGKYVFPENSAIEAGKFFVVHKKDFKFALNNSGAEAVYLYNPAEILISQVSYAGAKGGISYNFDGAVWRWSRFLTPGAANIFNNIPNAKTKKEKKIYAGVPAEFSAKASDSDKDKLKFTWDFGDRHKSYKKNTKHTFEKPGKYNVILKINDGSEDKIETFKIKVEKFPKSKIKIVAVTPNPKGKDSDAEYLIVENKSKKKINLKNWIIATGSKKLYNHPISDDLVINPGEKINVTREFSKFSLNNKKAKVELRYPNGKMAHKIKYALKESVPEDASYEKTQLGWAWIKKTIQKNTETKTVELASSVLEDKTANNNMAQTEEPSEVGRQSSTESKKNFQEKIILAVAQETEQKIENYLLVSKTYDLSMENNQYIFADHYIPQKHYVMAWWEGVSQKINLILRTLY